MAKLRSTIESKGARVIVVTLSPANEARDFCAERAPGITCYADVNAEAYKAFGLARATLASVFSPGVVVAGFKASLQGQRLGATQGDPLQLPGTFVIGTDARVTYAFYSPNVSVYPSETELLGAVANTK